MPSVAPSKCYLTTTTTGAVAWLAETRGTSVCRRQERLRGNSAVLCSPFKNHCHAVILRNTGHYCVVYGCGVCLDNQSLFLRVWLFMSVYVCVTSDSAHSSLPVLYCMFTHTDHQVIFRYCTPVVFFPSFAITLPLSMNEGFVWFFLQLSAVHCYPGFALPFPGLDTRLGSPLSLTEEMISDWERWGRNDKPIYPTSEPGL